MKKDLREGLKPYLPDLSLEPILDWIDGRKIHMKIARGRSTKLGDYRPPQKDEIHRISVNGDLNPYEFLITLTHEIAHLVVWEKYRRKVKPHGTAWKSQYAAMLEILLEKNIFPDELESIIRKQVANPQATSKSNTDLVRALHIHNDLKTGVFLEELPEGALFSLADGRRFRKEAKLRKWYRCILVDNRKIYRISPVTRVIPWED